MSPSLARCAALLLLGGARRADACTMIAVGADASESGAVMVGHSEDSGPLTNDVRLIRVPSRKWPKGSMRPLYKVAPGYPRLVDSARSPEYAPVEGQSDGQVPVLGYIPQVEETYGYWDTDYGIQNEKGLSIGESTCTANTVGWPADMPYGHNKAGIEELTKIALERCETARCAVQTMGEIAVEFGFYSSDSGDPANPGYVDSSECLGVGDAKGELWVFNVLTGRNNASAIWAAQRMPANSVVAIGNSFTIRKMNLSDSDNFLYSPGVTELAVEKGWWSPKYEATPDTFDFFSAYGYTPGTIGEPITKEAAQHLANLAEFYSGRRMWRIFSLLSPEEGAKLDPNRGNLPHTKDPYPAWVPAKPRSVTLQMVLNTYRDHMEGTPYDLTKGMAAGPHGNPNRAAVPPTGPWGQWERAISMYRSTWSFVSVAKPNGRNTLWFGWDAPHGTAYLPFYGAATSGGPDCYHSHSGTMSKFSFDVAWTPFAILNSFQDINFQAINADVRAKASRIEAEGLRLTRQWEQEADLLASPEASLAVLTERSNAFAEASVKEWWTFAFHTFLKFGHLTVTHNDTDKGEEAFGQSPPDWWLLSKDVGYTTWSRYGNNQSSTPDVVEAAADLAAAIARPPSAFSGAALVAMAAGLASSAVAYVAGLRHGRKDCASVVYMACP